MVDEAELFTQTLDLRKSFQWGSVLVVFLPLAGYYLMPYLLISRRVTLRPYVFAIVLFLDTIGIFFHYVSWSAEVFYIA